VFVSLGLGSVIASALDAAPWVMAVGRHKDAVFAALGLMLAVNYWLAIVRPRQMECAPGEICHLDSPAMRINRIVFWTSVAIWVSAVTVAYAALWWVRLQS
jgi:hypothetical protein